ncbi:hypothetical protein IFM89_014656 [Coptis chinensis]|uniref:Uncharacterized protein n=1 Tax=Coptis chinensis TaxID=261450 RepID=A0A835HHU7_9MAGN|nr:hypothetical protein IFM89_014656 [Coptis chinensis]
MCLVECHSCWRLDGCIAIGYILGTCLCRLLLLLENYFTYLQGASLTKKKKQAGSNNNTTNKKLKSSIVEVEKLL